MNHKDAVPDPLAALQKSVDTARAERKQRTTEKDVRRVPRADGYDWLLNNCSDLDQAAHAGHLDEGELVASCFHCQIGEGRRGVTPPGECEGCACVAEHDGDYGSSGHAGSCPPHTCEARP